MKRVQMTVLKSDIDNVIEYLGRNGAMHFSHAEDNTESDGSARIKTLLDRLHACAEFLEIELPTEPAADSTLCGETAEDQTESRAKALAEKLCAAIDVLKARELAVRQERQHIEEAYNEARAFANLNAPFSDLDHLSYLTLRVGHLDPAELPELKERLVNRAVIVPLGDDRVLAASSRKGRFALDTELKKCGFTIIAIPEAYQGVPSELLEGLQRRLDGVDRDFVKINGEKIQMRDELQAALQKLASLLFMVLAVERLKSQLTSTSSIYLFSGWVPADMISQLAADTASMTGGRTAIRVFNPNEIPEVRNGSEKVPVSLKHGAFVKGFEGMVLSYGAPPYGAIDPTPLVAFFYTLLFGIMFGDLGQGFVLLLLGLLAGKHGLKQLARFSKFSIPLVTVGIASMVMGFLTGEMFTSEHLLIAPTRAITAALTGQPMDRILTILPLAEKGGSITKLFYFFGFTIGIGIIINSLGLLINIVNCCILKKYREAFFTKTGLAGLLFFWYAICIGLRCIFGGRGVTFEFFDIAGLCIPLLCIFFGPVIWRCITRTQPILEHGLMAFIMEGIVEMMETASNYFSNTASFLRVGAFALSHAILAFVVFRFTEDLANTGTVAGSVSALLVLVFGNLVIILLEGLIVAIQVMRLQYYEFFGKFFTSTGVAFSPFRFNK
ncbi:MAG: V-type ATP synthase subunit I [Treponema sp.]|nr:V-type ATP synthase subunit I [Treponema sp.]